MDPESQIQAPRSDPSSPSCPGAPHPSSEAPPPATGLPVPPPPPDHSLTGNGSPPSAVDAISSNQAGLPIRNFKRRTRNGKVARLPWQTRDRINNMLRDGLSGRKILTALGDDTTGLTLNNLSEWKRGGYLDWLEELHWADQLRAQQESALEFFHTNNELKFNQAVLQIGVTQILQVLRGLTPVNLNGQVNGDLSGFTRLLNSLSRLSRETLTFKKYDDVSFKQKEIDELLKKRDPNREFNDAERDLWLAGCQRLFGFKPDKPIGPPLSEVLAKSQAAKAPPLESSSPAAEPPNLPASNPDTPPTQTP